MSNDGQAIGFTTLGSVVSQQQLIEATSIVGYQSQGNLLVIGSSDEALEAISQLPGLRSTVISIDDAATFIAKNITDTGTTVYQTNKLNLTGHLGNYQAVAIAGDDELDLGVGVYLPDGLFDLVLDLSSTPVLSAELPPFGYLHAPDRQSLQSALEQLPDLVGDFEKPKYFNYRAKVCAHSRSELNGCNNCIDVCAAGAITTKGEGISVDPYLCQGCGSCATVCPSGALSYAYPRVSDAISRSREMITAKQSCTSVLLHSEDQQHLVDQTALPEDMLALAVEEVTAFGMDYWASLVASGSQRIYLLFNEGPARSDRDAVLEQASVFHLMLQGLGVAEPVVTAINEYDLTQLVAEPARDSVLASITPASFTTHDDKRQTLRMAMDHLYEQLDCESDVVALPASAAHGTVTVDDSSCTLCMACVSVCPGKALLDGQDTPALRMIEANCLQCGLCETACPESAITLKTHYRYDSIEARKITTLNEEEPFHCITCHKAFASQRMIGSMLTKLSSHWMYKDKKALRRLKMCEDCRVKDIFSDDKAGIEVHRDTEIS